MKSEVDLPIPYPWAVQARRKLRTTLDGRPLRWRTKRQAQFAAIMMTFLGKDGIVFRAVPMPITGSC